MTEQRANQAIPAIHAHWTAPRSAGPVLPPAELVTMIFSALAWRRFHGPITLFADSRTLEYLDERHMLGVYHDVRSAEVDQIDTRRYQPDLYFSLPKLVALQLSAAPVAVLDLDLFLRQPLPPLGPNQFMFAHHELLTGFSYPPLSELPNPNRVDFPDWDDELLACNVAVAAFGSQRHLDDFTDLALAFIADNHEEAPIFEWSRIIFAEQRLSGYTARRNGVELAPVTASIWDPAQSRWTGEDPDPMFHHTWFRKHLYAGRPSVRDRYCIRLVSELLATFPEAGDLLDGDPQTRKYVAEAAAPGARDRRGLRRRWRLAR